MNLRYGFLFVAIQLYQKRGFHAIFLLKNIEFSRCKSTFTSAKFELNDNSYKFEVKSNMLNHINTLHGGELVKHFDNAAGMTAMKFAEKKVVTAAIKEVNFFEKILVV